MMAPGTRIGPYEITASLGAGGMGEVYRARDARLNRDVAIKILPAAFANDPGRMARFEREAQVLAALNHPNNRRDLRHRGGRAGDGAGRRTDARRTHRTTSTLSLPADPGTRFSKADGSLWRVASVNGNATLLTSPDRTAGKALIVNPGFSDGRHFSYTALSIDSEKSAIYTADLESKSRSQVLASNSNAVCAYRGYLLFTHDDNLMAQAFDANRREARRAA